MPVNHFTDMFEDCQAFARVYSEKTGKPFGGKIDVPFIVKMIEDEFEELTEAKDTAEEVDALLDALYYIFDHLAKSDIEEGYIMGQLNKMQKEIFCCINRKRCFKICREKVSEDVALVLETIHNTSYRYCKADILLDVARIILTTLSDTIFDYFRIWDLIHEANMKKFGPGGYHRDDGKWMKPKDFVPPDEMIRKVIQENISSYSC